MPKRERDGGGGGRGTSDDNTDSTLETTTSSAGLTYEGELIPLGSTNSNAEEPVPVTQFFIVETRSRGWAGSAFINAYFYDHLTPAQAFAVALQQGFLPGSAVSLNLLSDQQSSSVMQKVRTWPSIITRVATVRSSDAGVEDLDSADISTICEIYFSDPLSYLWNSPIWGVYQDCSPGPMLGGALLLAAGYDGRPTLEPKIPGFPSISISENVRTDISKIPYAIAAGETLKDWLGAVFGRLGVRIEISGDTGDNVSLMLRDEPPVRGETLRLEATEANGVLGKGKLDLNSLTVRPIMEKRGAILDNPTRGSIQRVGEAGPVEMSFYGSNISTDEAQYRNVFSFERDILSAVTVSGQSVNADVYSGKVIEFTNDPEILYGKYWQVVDVAHTYQSTGYTNSMVLEKRSVAWRPLIPADWGPVVVSGIVDDGESDKGQTVERDRVGRIPINFTFTPEYLDSPSTSNATKAWPPTIPLTLIEPMAGSVHGFIPAHRQGDLCRISIQNPLYAEVIGFGYRSDRRLAENISDISAGVVVRHNGEHWQGMLFRPYDKIAEDAANDTSTGDDSTSTPTGDDSTSTPTGDDSTSTPTGDDSTSTPTGDDSTSTSTE